jgi:hypothetical protein
MSYAIGQVGFGIDIPDNLYHEINDSDFIEIISNVNGVETFYSASSYTPVLIGIRVATINECHTVCLDTLMSFFDGVEDLEAKFETIRKELIENLEIETDPVLKNALEYIKTATPKKIIVWSSS